MLGEKKKSKKHNLFSLFQANQQILLLYCILFSFAVYSLTELLPQGDREVRQGRTLVPRLSLNLQPSPCLPSANL